MEVESALDKLAMESATLEGARAKRKAKALPFGGSVDPMKPIREREIPQMLPREGRDLQVDVPTIVEAERPSSRPIDLRLLPFAFSIMITARSSALKWLYPIAIHSLFFQPQAGLYGGVALGS